MEHISSAFLEFWPISITVLGVIHLQGSSILFGCVLEMHDLKLKDGISLIFVQKTYGGIRNAHYVVVVLKKTFTSLSLIIGGE